MGGYSSTPRKGKTSEEEGDESLFYAASGMQGWRASMEDAHIALLKVPHGQPPTSAAIGAARIGLFSNQSHKPPLRRSGSRGGIITAVGDSNGPSASGAQAARRRAETFSAGDTEGLSQQGRLKDETGSQQTAAISREGPRRASTGAVKGRSGFAAASDDSGGGGDGSSCVGAGWKAVDLLEDAALFGVFDGHGGKAVADFCKERLPGLLAASPDIRAGNWRDGFPRVYHALDALLKSGEGQEKTGGWGGATKVDGIGVGCTIVTALLDRKRGQCYVAHAGDSRCVLCRAGRAVQLTRDHKPGMPSEYARIVAAGGHVSRAGRVNDNLNLSRAIGDMVYKRNHLRQPKDQIISAEPDVCRFMVTPGVDEFLILACDGVWEMMNTTQVVAFVRSGLRAGSAPREVCESLLDACLSPDPKGTRYAGCDNMTVLLVLLDGWEGALATKAYTPALTFSGGRIGSVGEAAAAMSATLPKMPRPLSNARPPLPAEFRAAMSTGTTAPAPKPESDSQAAQEAGAANRDKPAAPAPETEPSGDGNASQGSATVGATDSAAKMGWTQRRIAAGKVAPPRTAHGIEFALASFSAPFVAKAPAAGSRMSTGSINSRGVVTAATGASATAGDLATSSVAKQRNASRASSSSVPPNARRRNSNHLRSATAPMLPSPLWHHRQRREPPEERIAAAAAIAVLAEVGAAGAVAASALAKENAAPPCQNPSANGRPGGMAEVDSTAEVCGRGKAGEESGRQAPPSEDAGLVFVPVEPSATPSEVTVTATASPHHPT
ncbi:Chain A, Crystal Structure Of Anopheles Gambiae SerTHR PHOSPHATASE Complexed With Zn2+ [Ectocarpus siliculosus]|uniref:Chain A, Crystal Structure Of Anopheles Gambiae SerTHR PHOSPHATASE Complexed With Zn2 n=1 Tax=Ectocarpus siliculosus TaxID=2880 RepID=D7FSC8_ECTSI|nr:Chain A, Crystal Structure Of Anopheles Gambiae SerTHR PHOSPHATASE Complexed With Zn2+ [Ectocarpus siliculosus]|eukprot:CBJ31069.1 Chain A, Crystal Structure Of Anopheles Gambiae SerTHR PHOSPHATASE Complexed With Zn2+ [Ectocarpus siliculosus]